MKALLMWIVAVPMFGGAATFSETFTVAPTNWSAHGIASLFVWNTNAQAVDVTWDSRESNSFFYHKLGTVLTRHDDFSIAFDLMLQDANIGVTPNRPYTFEVSLGLIHLQSATATNFVRGQFRGTRNIVEFDYFPAFSSFGATVATTMVSSNSAFAYSHNFPMEITLGDRFNVQMAYAASNSTLTTTLTRNGGLFGPVEPNRLGSSFSDFRVDAFAISNYSDEGADGSILAHGSVDNIVLVYPEPPLGRLAGRWVENVFEVGFQTRSDWDYQLEHTTDLASWKAVGPAVAGTGGELALSHHAEGFYRVRAERP